MRSATIAGAVVLTLSTAALAQVGSAPEEQKLAAGNETARTNDTGSPPDTMLGNTADPEPGSPSTAPVNSVDDAAALAGQRPPR